MKKTAIKSVSDIASGAILTTKKGHEYILLRDDSGVPSMFGKDGRFVRLNPNGLADVKGGHQIDKVSAFLTMPQADQISEALKYLYTGREACADLTTIFTAENPIVKKAKEDLDNISSQMLNTLRTLSENGVDTDELVEDLLNRISSDDDNDYDDDDDYDEDDDEY